MRRCDKPRRLCRISQRFSNLHNTVLQRFIADIAVLPEDFQQPLFRDHFAGMSGEVLKKGEGLRPEMHSLRAAPERFVGSINREYIEGDRLVLTHLAIELNEFLLHLHNAYRCS